MAEYKMRVDYKILGGHTHMQVRTGHDDIILGLAGELTMTNEEFSAWRNNSRERADGNIFIEFREEPNG